MPKQSDRARYLNQLEFMISRMIRLRRGATYLCKIAIVLFQIISQTRYLNLPEPIPKQKALRELLWLYNDRTLKQIARMDKQTFKSVVDRIENNPVFSNRSANKQAEVEVQLILCLQRFGCEGNGASIGSNSRMLGIGEGTVGLYTNRIMKALLFIRDDVIYWPDVRERQAISRRFEGKYGLPGAVSVLDGTPIPYSQRPGIDGEVYWSRKCIYCMNLQLICDDRKLIRYYIIGWPGSVYDNTMKNQD